MIWGYHHFRKHPNPSPKFAGRFAQAASATLPVGSMACCEGSYLAASPKPHSNDVMHLDISTGCPCSTHSLMLLWGNHTGMKLWSNHDMPMVHRLTGWSLSSASIEYIAKKQKTHVCSIHLKRDKKDQYRPADICSQLNVFAKYCFLKSSFFELLDIQNFKAEIGRSRFQCPCLGMKSLISKDTPPKKRAISKGKDRLPTLSGASC